MRLYWKRAGTVLVILLTCISLWGCSIVVETAESLFESLLAEEAMKTAKDVEETDVREETTQTVGQTDGEEEVLAGKDREDTEETDTEEESTGFEPAAKPEETSLAEEKNSQVPVDFMPDWYQWSYTGYDAQDIDLEYLQAGKWVSQDGNTVLYVDYSSPDAMDFGLYSNGTIWDDFHWAEVDWDNLNAQGEPDTATDWENSIRFTVLQKGVMDVEINGTRVTLYLKRAKYQ